MIKILKTATAVLMFFLIFSVMSLTRNMLLQNGSDAALYAALFISIIQYAMIFVAAKEVMNAVFGGKHGQ